jgi:hypothetical protein
MCVGWAWLGPLTHLSISVLFWYDEKGDAISGQAVKGSAQSSSHRVMGFIKYFERIPV